MLLNTSVRPDDFGERGFLDLSMLTDHPLRLPNHFQCRGTLQLYDNLAVLGSMNLNNLQTGHLAAANELDDLDGCTCVDDGGLPASLPHNLTIQFNGNPIARQFETIEEFGNSGSGWRVLGLSIEQKANLVVLDCFLACHRHSLRDLIIVQVSYDKVGRDGEPHRHVGRAVQTPQGQCFRPCEDGPTGAMNRCRHPSSERAKMEL